MLGVMSHPTQPRLCPHRQNPQACLTCFHNRSVQPAPQHVPQGQGPRYTAAGQLAFDAPPQVQRGVDRAMRGFVASMPDTSSAPQGEQAVEPSEKTSAKVSTSDGAGTHASQKQVAASVPPGQAVPLQQPFAAPRPDPGHDYDARGAEKLWEPDKAQGAKEQGLIDKLPVHPEVAKNRR